MKKPVRSQHDPFAPQDWAWLATVAAIWGASFLFIDIGVDHFEPALVAFLRLWFGVAALAVIPAARRAVPLSEWPTIALLGVVWMALPFLLFFDGAAVDRLIARRHVERRGAAVHCARWRTRLSSQTGPASAPRIARRIRRRGRRQLARGRRRARERRSVSASCLLATLCYGFAGNLASPLQVRNGALPVVLRAALVALAVMTPLGLRGIADSTFAWSSLLAVAALGIFGTAIAFVGLHDARRPGRGRTRLGRRSISSRSSRWCSAPSCGMSALRRSRSRGRRSCFSVRISRAERERRKVDAGARDQRTAASARRGVIGMNRPNSRTAESRRIESNYANLLRAR